MCTGVCVRVVMRPCVSSMLMLMHERAFTEAGAGRPNETAVCVWCATCKLGGVAIKVMGARPGARGGARGRTALQRRREVHSGFF